MATAFDLHPRGNARQAFLRVSLEDVRAANDIIISYDLDRDGWKVESPTKMMWTDGEDTFEERLEEVAFIPAWSDKAAAELERINGPATPALSTEETL